MKVVPMIAHDFQGGAAHRGFTLFELLVVMVIIGIAASLVVPRLGGGVDKMQLRTATRDLASVMRFARSQAVTHGGEHQVLFDTATRGVAIHATTTADVDGTAADSSSEDIPSRHRYQLPDGIMLHRGGDLLAQADQPVLLASFFSMGNSTGGTIRLTGAQDRSRSIRIDAITGLVTVAPDTP
jgi:general secretion pathway protein H